MLPLVSTAGYEHSLAVDTNGNIWAWGYNGYGQLGNNSTSDSASPVQLGSLPATAVAVAAGAYHSVALLSNGQVFAWGYNGYGQLGTGDFAAHYVPVQTAGVHGATAIAASFYDSYASQSDGSIWATGYSGYGSLGNSTYTSTSAPTKLVGLSGSPAAVSAGGFSSPGLHNPGAGSWFGYKSHRQGGGSPAPPPDPPGARHGTTGGGAPHRAHRGREQGTNGGSDHLGAVSRGSTQARRQRLDLGLQRGRRTRTRQYRREQRDADVDNRLCRRHRADRSPDAERHGRQRSGHGLVECASVERG